MGEEEGERRKGEREEGKKEGGGTTWPSFLFGQIRKQEVQRA